MAKVFIFIVALFLASTTQAAENASRFAIISAGMRTAFDEQVEAGCVAAAEKTGSKYSCLYLTLSSNGDVAEQVKLVESTLEQGVAGIAIDPTDSRAVAPVLKEAVNRGIPVVTWGDDLAPEYQSLRSAFIGTNEYQLGVELADAVRRTRPAGGKLCIATPVFDAASSARIHGIRDTFAGRKTFVEDGSKLAGERGWYEADNCPIAERDFPRSLQRVSEELTSDPGVNTVIFPMAYENFDPGLYESIFAPFRDRLSSNQLVLAGVGFSDATQKTISSDAPTYVVQLLPRRLGEWVFNTLFKLTQGEKVEPEIPVNVDVCKPSNDISCSESVVCPDREPKCPDETCSPECK
jgi:ribose transport system substrate-binding protein